MIYELANAAVIPKLLELARDVPDVPLDKLERMMIELLPRKDAKIFVAEKDSNLQGFVFATEEEFDGEDVIFIQFCVIRPDRNERNIGFELLNRLKKWGRESGKKWIFTMVSRNHKPFQRKYRFNYHSVVLKRRIEDNVETIPIEKKTRDYSTNSA